MIIELQEKENSIQFLNQTIEELKKENKRISSEMVSNTEYNRLKDELTNIKHQNSQLIELLVDSVNIGDEVANALMDKNKADSKLKMQLSYLESQNKRYHNVIDRLKSKWYGKLSLKIYKFLFAH